MVAAMLSTGESTAELALGMLGFCTAVWVISSPIPTFKAIWTTHEVGETNPYSYLSVLFNSAIWVVFGIPALNHLVHGHHRTIADWLGAPLMGANCYGVVAELCYVAIFIRFAVGQRCLPVISLVVVVVLALLLATHWSRTFVGHIAMYSGVAMYAIPVYSTYVAYRANDVAQISAYQASASFANGAVWTAYACINHVRAFVFVPNLAALICAGGQLGVWGWLKFKAARQAAAARRAAEEQEQAEAAERRGLARDLEAGGGSGGGGGDVQLALQPAEATGGGRAVQGRAGAGAQAQALHADENEVLVPVQDPEAGAGGVEAALGMGVAGALALAAGDGDNNDAENQFLAAAGDNGVLVLVAGDGDNDDLENQVLAAAAGDNGVLVLAAGEDDGNNHDGDEHGGGAVVEDVGKDDDDDDNDGA